MNANKPEKLPLSVLFFGTPEIALAPLRALSHDNRFRLLGVVTQTDKPSGRGNKLTPPPVKRLAEELKLPVFQPESLKKPERDGGLGSFLSSAGKIDFFVVVAYGKIIPKTLLEVPLFGAINIHFSLLPRWRGAAPVQRAILAGDKETGIAIMKMDVGLDTGPVYTQHHVHITPSDTTGSLSDTLSRLGAEILPDTLQEIAAGVLQPQPQPSEGATYAEKLTPQDFIVSWDSPATTILQIIQAASPHPGARSTFQGEVVKIFSAQKTPLLSPSTSLPGTVIESNSQGVIVSTQPGESILLRELQFPNRKRLAVCEILKSRDIPVGSRFGDPV